MKRPLSLLALLASSAALSQPGPLPRGAALQPTGFATIERAPASDLPEQPPPAENRPGRGANTYARMAGITESEAEKRLAEQRSARPQFTRLLATLRARERGNFTDARMVHSPDWAYVFYFKRSPERTLARYARHPHFKAAQALYSQAELQTIAAPWVERFTRERLLGGYGADATYGEVRMDLVVSEAEYAALARREGWRPHPAIRLAFAPAVAGDPVPASLRPLLRIFPQSDRALGPTHQALLGGRLELRDGCFYVTRPGQGDRLAYFAREVALGLDGQNYLALRTRDSEPRLLGRVGEEFSWGGPIAAPETLPMVGELRARCGDAPLEHVGVPQSARLFRVRAWVIDAIAQRRRIGRDEAWRRFKACLETREARTTEGYFDCDTL